MPLLDKLSDNIYAHDKEVTMCNTGVISTDTGNYVIDTGMYPKIATKLLGEVKDMKKTFEGTFITHYHFDHVGGNQAFTSKPIYAHKLCSENFVSSYSQEELDKEISDDENKELYEGFKLTDASNIYDTEIFSPAENSDIVCYLTGGHTSGSVIVHYKPENIVFAGDNVFAKTFPWGGDKSADPYKMLSSIKKILSFNPQIVVPGHGPVQHDLEDIHYFKEYMTKILETGEEGLKENKDDESIFSELMAIPFHADPDQRKPPSVKHWIEVIKAKHS